MTHSKPTIDAPGLSIRSRADGTYRLLWRAPAWAKKAGYTSLSENLPFDLLNPDDHPLIIQACRNLTSRAEQWKNEKARGYLLNGTVQSISRLYLTSKSSPYHRAAQNTQRLYDYELRLIERTIGSKRIDSITTDNIMEWYQACLDSVESGGVRKGQSFIKRLRAIASFGAINDVPGCQRLDYILSKMRFETPERRSSVLTYDMALRIISKAHETGNHSIALAQAIQFETGLRQTDVTGQWERCEQNDQSPYRTNTHRWVPGLVWQNISKDLILTITTSKTGASVTHDLSVMPLVKAEIERIPRENRTGPVIINEVTGRPYLPNRFSIKWRKVADLASIPKDVWNRDSRAGAISEGDEAGAEISNLQRMAGHTNSRMTQRYIRGENIESSRTVAELRSIHRNTKKP